MSVNDSNMGAPIDRGSPLARVLDGYGAPELGAGFADRVVAAAAARPAPLPELRRPAPVGARGWRMGRRIAIGIASFGALATTAAATGLLQQIALPLPSAQSVWASIAGTAAAENTPQVAAAAQPRPAADPSAAAVAIDGPIDTPEELAEAFRRVEQVRAGRREERRVAIDQRIKNEIERRRAAGLPVPTPEEEARFRARVEQEMVRREQRADQQIAARREAMQRKVESGQAVTREDLSRRPPADPALRQTVRELRELTPAERREAWRSLPSEQRRAIMQQLRERRGAASPSAPAPEQTPAPAPANEPTPAG